MIKKITLYSLLFTLCACGNYIKNENGSEYLVKLDAEPKGCTYLYKLESEASVYDADDADRYLANQIARQEKPGNAYWITSQRTRPNEGVVFGPEKTFIFNANVYDCPNARHIETTNSVKTEPSEPASMYGVMY